MRALPEGAPLAAPAWDQPEFPPIAFRAGFASIPGELTIADLDADGDLDIALANYLAGNVSILLGDGRRGFTHAPDATVGQPLGVAAGLFDADLLPDLVLSQVAQEAHGVGPLLTAANPSALAVADLDGDGMANAQDARALARRLAGN